MKPLTHYLFLPALFICMFSFFIHASDKILIITHAFNRPDFIEIQNKTFKAFLEDDYEFIVFNDARDTNIRTEIHTICRKLNLQCINIPQGIHRLPYLPRANYEHFNDPSCRASHAIQYSLDIWGFDHPGIVAIIDSDMFLIKKFSIKKHLEGYDLFGCQQSRQDRNVNIVYLWNGLVFMNMKTLPNRKTLNWNCGPVEGQHTDTGGFTHYYLKNNPSVRTKFYACIRIEQLPKDTEDLKKLGYSNSTIQFIQQNPHWMEFHADSNFLHYRAGGGWVGHQSAAYHAEKTRILNNFINTIINNKV